MKIVEYYLKISFTNVVKYNTFVTKQKSNLVIFIILRSYYILSQNFYFEICLDGMYPFMVLKIEIFNIAIGNRTRNRVCNILQISFPLIVIAVHV